MPHGRGTRNQKQETTNQKPSLFIRHIGRFVTSKWISSQTRFEGVGVFALLRVARIRQRAS
jgi:hypothetical protein